MRIVEHRSEDLVNCMEKDRQIVILMGSLQHGRHAHINMIT